MELKDMVLSTIAELDDEPEKQEVGFQVEEVVKEPSKPKAEVAEKKETKKDNKNKNKNEEEIFLDNVKERVLVLFEGLQSPNNKNIETRVDITLNFLEYLLSSIDERLEKVK